MFGNPATLRFRSLALDDKDPSNILMPLLLLAANVMFVKIGSAFSDIAMGSSRLFLISMPVIVGCEPPSQERPYWYESVDSEFEKTPPASTYVTLPKLLPQLPPY